MRNIETYSTALKRMFRLVKDASLGEYIITATISFVTASVVVAEHVIAVYLSSFWGHLLTFLKELQAVARNVKDRSFYDLI